MSLNINKKLNHNLFNNIDNSDVLTDHVKAYLLGFLVNSSYVMSNKIQLKIKIYKDFDYILTLIKLLFNSELLEIYNKNNLITIFINSKQVCEDYLELLYISTGKSFDKIKFPNLFNIITKTNQSENKIKEDYTLYYMSFIRGYFDFNGQIDTLDYTNNPKCIIHFQSLDLIKEFKLFLKIPNSSLNNKIIFTSTNCIDFLGLIYNCKNNIFYYRNNYQKFQNLINWKLITTNIHHNQLDKCKIYKTDNNAIIPSKHHESDVGYDLTIIKKVKNLTPSTILYDTGIKISVDYGYYIEIAPRSSLSKSGYMLANSIGIIEKSYSGNLYIALIKIDKDMPDLELPFRCCQLIFKSQISLEIEVVNDNIFDKTTRNSGGFGSSN